MIRQIGLLEKNCCVLLPICDNLMNLLISYIPLLLENEEFFKTEFY